MIVDKYTDVAKQRMIRKLRDQGKLIKGIESRQMGGTVLSSLPLGIPQMELFIPAKEMPVSETSRGILRKNGGESSKRDVLPLPTEKSVPRGQKTIKKGVIPRQEGGKVEPPSPKPKKSRKLSEFERKKYAKTD